MIVGKIISILDVSIKVILSSNDLEVGDVLTTEDGKYEFEVVIIDSVEATCITLNYNHGLKKGSKLIKKEDTTISTQPKIQAFNDIKLRSIKFSFKSFIRSSQAITLDFSCSFSFVKRSISSCNGLTTLLNK